MIDRTRSFLSRDTGLLILFSAVWVLFHVLTNGQYGFHRDELDTLDNARHLAWGYVAYPPLTPFVARVGLALFGPSLIGVRLFAALSQGAVALLTGLMVRDMGGNRLAQVTAAFAAVISPVALTAGVMLHYLSFDYLWWVLAAFCVVRLIHTQNRRWWVGVGAAIGLGMMTKFTMIFFAMGIAGGVLLTARRKDLLNHWLWLGAGAALLVYAPNLIWQIQHGFITLDFLSAIHARDVLWGRSDDFLVRQLYDSLNPVSVPFAVAGLYAVMRSPTHNRFRILGWMYLIPFAALFLSEGRSYYVAPAYPMLIAAGVSWLAGWISTRPVPQRRALVTVTWAALFVFMVVAAFVALPVVPVNASLWETTNAMNENFREMIGWPELVETVAQVYSSLPEEVRSRTAILTGNYGETGAINVFGSEYGLPEAISGVDSAWYRGYGETPASTVIVVGFERAAAGSLFQACEVAAQVSNGFGVSNTEMRTRGIYICGEPRHSWDQVWAQVQAFQ